VTGDPQVLAGLSVTATAAKSRSRDYPHDRALDDGVHGMASGDRNDRGGGDNRDSSEETDEDAEDQHNTEAGMRGPRVPLEIQATPLYEHGGSALDVRHGTDSDRSPSALGVSGLGESMLVSLLTDGGIFMKSTPATNGGRGRGQADGGRVSILLKPRFVWCSADLRTLYWRAVGNQVIRGGMDTRSILRVEAVEPREQVEGTGLGGTSGASLRIVGEHRSLELEVTLGESPAQGEAPQVARARDVWVEAFRFLIRFHQREPKLTGF